MSKVIFNPTGPIKCALLLSGIVKSVDNVCECINIPDEVPLPPPPEPDIKCPPLATITRPETGSGNVIVTLLLFIVVIDKY